MASGRAGVRSRWQRAGDLFMHSVPSSQRRLRAVGNLGVAMVAGLAGVSLLLGDLSGVDVDVAGGVMLALAAGALTASIRGFRPPPRADQAVDHAPTGLGDQTG